MLAFHQMYINFLIKSTHFFFRLILRKDVVPQDIIISKNHIFERNSNN